VNRRERKKGSRRMEKRRRTSYQRKEYGVGGKSTKSGSKERKEERESSEVK